MQTDLLVAVTWAASTGLNSLTTVTFPASIVEFPELAFIACYNLSTINYKGTEEQWPELTFYIDEAEGGAFNGTINYNYNG